MDHKTELLNALAATDKPLFAVIDGVQIEGLQSFLFDAKLKYRPLFLGDGDDERIAAGPHLVEVPSQAAQHSVLDIMAHKTYGLVFWAGEIDFEGLCRHLRTINMVYIPDARPEAEQRDAQDWAKGSVDESEEQPNEDTGETTQKYERVLFRHADANVMTQVLPALNESQFARLMGPAQQLVFAPSEEWGGGIKRALRPKDIIAPKGPLRLDHEALAVIGDARSVHSRQKIRKLLQNSAPQIFMGMDDRQADALVLSYEKSGRTLGLTTERGFYQWTYLMGASKGKFIEQPHIKEHIVQGPETPDKNLDFIMKTMSQAGVRL